MFTTLNFTVLYYTECGKKSKTDKKATVNNAGVKFTRYKMWGCLD